MRRRAQPRMSWLGRMARGLRPNCNLLRRGTDRAEATIKVALLAAFLPWHLWQWRRPCT